MRSISHELKTPLNVISGNVQLMNMGVYGSVEHLREPIEAIEEAVKRARLLVDNLLEYSRIEAGHFVVKSELISFSDLGPLVYEYKQLAFQKNLHFDFQFLGHEPFSADFMILSTIISNLLSNAIKYTEKGYVTGFIDVRDNKIVIEVKDSGKGIEKEKIPFIFDPFYSESREKGLSGLGLAIVKRFIDILQGSIEVESTPGRGTRFRVELPRLRRPLTYEEKEHRQILLVDSDESIRKMLREVLKGYSVVEASCGAEGYLRALEHTPDLVVTSIGLRDISGEELVARLRDEPTLKETQYVLYTGATPREEGNIVFQKGMHVKELSSKLKLVMGRRILMVYFPSVSENLETVKKAVEESISRVVNVMSTNTILEEEVGIYDSFIVLSRKEEVARAAEIMEEILSIKPPGTISVMLFVEKGGEVSW